MKYWDTKITKLLAAGEHFTVHKLLIQRDMNRIFAQDIDLKIPLYGGAELTAWTEGPTKGYERIAAFLKEVKG